MTIIGHGHWAIYIPAKEDWPKHAPPTAAFAKRESDGMDWYTFMATMDPATVKGTASKQGEHFIIGPVTYDATRLFPAGQFLFEVTDYAGTDPFADLNGRVIDIEAGKIGMSRAERAKAEGPNIFQRLDDLTARVAALEDRRK